MTKTKKTKKIVCSFCGKDHEEVVKIVHGKEGNICSECLDVCLTLVGDSMGNSFYDDYSEFAIQSNTKGRKSKKDAKKDIKLLLPEEIYKRLGDYVIGQEAAKKTLAVAVYNHYKRILNPEKKISKDLQEVKLTKSNVLMVGPTGVGKTLIAQTLAEILNVPFAIVDATSLTEAGYVGEDVESIILKLLQASEYDVEKAQLGIIYIDEIDKISRKGENPSITRDVSGEGVQHALLKIIEGTIAHVQPQGGRKHPSMETIPVDTSNILFICGGAFTGIEKIIENRLNKGSLGFRVNLPNNDGVPEVTDNLIEEDLFKFGLIQELIGRLPVLVTLDKMDETTIYKILKEPKNALTLQYKKLFALDGIKLSFSDDALKDIAKIVSKRSLGARGARSYLEGLLRDTMFEVPSNKEKIKEILIDQDVANKKIKPILINK